MAKELALEEVRCRKCRRYLCAAIGMVEIKCPSCKTVNRVATARTGEGVREDARPHPNTLERRKTYW